MKKTLALILTVMLTVSALFTMSQIASSAETPDSSAFSDCTSLVSIVISDNVKLLEALLSMVVLR